MEICDELPTVRRGGILATIVPGSPRSLTRRRSLGTLTRRSEGMNVVDVVLGLIHGGHHGAWCWDLVLKHLDTPAVAVDLPGRNQGPLALEGITLDDWAQSAIEQISSASDAPIVLVGHSLGGVTVTEVARRIADRIAALVFVSCLVPEEGDTAARTAVGEGWEAIFDESGVFAVAPAETLRPMFGNDLSDRAWERQYSKLCPEPRQPLVTPITRVGLPDVPRIYVRLRKDQSVTWEMQSTMIANLGGAEEITLDAGHSVMLSQPEALAETLDSIAEMVG